MLALGALSLPLLMAVCCFVPGFVLVRKLRWTPGEKICGALGASLVILYLAAFLIYLIWAPLAAYWILSGAFAVGGIFVWRDLWNLVRVRGVRRLIAGFGFLLLWALSLLLLVRTYSGGGWGGDWIEHFHRSLFFLHHLPLETTFVDLYPLPARPPMMNLLAAFFLAQAGDSFENFCVVFLILNLFLYFPCALMLSRFARRGSRAIPILVGLLACSPIVMQNATYTWTKSLCSFFVVLGIWFYLAGLRKNDSVRIVAAFVSLAAGMLVHFAAGPYLVFITGHLLVTSLGTRWRAILVAGICAALLFGTWLTWSIENYGLRATFGSNTSVTTSQQSGGSNVRKILLNVRDTIIPHPLREVKVYRDQRQAGYVRDYFFLIYQTNLIAAMGIAGGFVVALLFFRVAVRGREVFWLIFVPFVIVLGIAVVGERDPAGSAHLTLQPLVLLGLTFLAARFFTLRPLVRWIVVCGCVVDLVVGVFLQHDLEHYENDACSQNFQVSVRNSALGLSVLTETDIAPAATSNWQLKQYGFVAKTLAPVYSSLPLTLRARAEVMHRLQVQSRVLRDDDLRWWGGWWRRHGDRLTFLGDHIGCHVWFLYAFDALMLIGLVAYTRRQPMVAVVEQPSEPQRRSRRARRRARRR